MPSFCSFVAVFGNLTFNLTRKFPFPPVRWFGIPSLVNNFSWPGCMTSPDELVTLNVFPSKVFISLENPVNASTNVKSSSVKRSSPSHLYTEWCFSSTTKTIVCAWPGINSSPALGKLILVPAFQPGLTVTSSTFSDGTRRPDPSFCFRVILRRFVVPVYKLHC